MKSNFRSKLAVRSAQAIKFSPEFPKKETRSSLENKDTSWNRIGIAGSLVLIFITSIVSILELHNQNTNLEQQNILLNQQIQSLKVQSNEFSSGVSRDLDLQNTEIIKIIIEKPFIYPYFYTGKAPDGSLSEDKRAQIDMIAEMFLDFIESFTNPYVTELPQMKLGEEFRNSWEAYFEDLFENSPILCARIREHRDWYTNKRFDDYLANQCLHQK